MFIISLKRLLPVVLFCASSIIADAQQIHFIYLQSQDEQPFYVKMNNKVVSSSVTGYLIIPKLSDGAYNLNVGFPKKEFPEENFQINIDRENEGFLLKNFDNKGWGLFNLQSFAITMGNNTAGNTETVAKNVQSDSFSQMLATVVKDSSILQKPEVEQQVTEQPKIDSETVSAPMQPAVIAATKILSKKSKDGLEMIYVDHEQDNNDTIRIFMPARKAVVAATKLNAVTEDDKTATPIMSDTIVNKAIYLNSDTISALKTITSKTDTTKTDSPITFNTPDTSTIVADNNFMAQKDTSALKNSVEEKESEQKPKDATTNSNENSGATIVIIPQVIKSSEINSDCKAFADNEDFLRLRKKMASGNSDDDMINIAKKVFHAKCFSTEQVKNLSFLFLTNEGKYRFFDIAYAFTSDSDQFSVLQYQLTDIYYINRFKAMINK